MEAEKFLKALGIGLSKALRYTFPGFLLVSMLVSIDQSTALLVVSTLGWQLTTLCALALGVGLYATHRGLIIPLHHLLGCFILSCGDFFLHIKPENSLSPTRWLGYLKVPRFRRFLAYTLLRHDFFDEKQREYLDVRHAEDGLIILISETFIAAETLYPWLHSTRDFDPGWPLIFGIILFLLSSVTDIQQHRIECVYLKTDEAKVTQIVKKFIPS